MPMPPASSEVGRASMDLIGLSCDVAGRISIDAGVEGELTVALATLRNDIVRTLLDGRDRAVALSVPPDRVDMANRAVETIRLAAIQGTLTPDAPVEDR